VAFPVCVDADFVEMRGAAARGIGSMGVGLLARAGRAFCGAREDERSIALRFVDCGTRAAPCFGSFELEAAAADFVEFEAAAADFVKSADGPLVRFGVDLGLSRALAIRRSLSPRLDTIASEESRGDA
jgi:hypothetical protein